MKKPRVYVPAMPPKPKFSPMATARRRIVFPTTWENTGWMRLKGTSTEELVVRVKLSNGEVHEMTQHMSYEVGEREGIIERTLAGKGTMADLQRVYSIKTKRARLRQESYAALEAQFGRGISA